LNEPYKPNTDELKNTWDSLSQSDKNNNLQAMWRNKAISDTYEPGSTFKLVTASAALEEGITQTDKEGEFCCTGGIEIAGVRIKCWRYYRPHGSESLRQALMNSCNPVFIGLGQKLGVNKYYSYLKKFGFLGITGIDLPGEAKGIFLAENKVGPVELRNNCIWAKIRGNSNSNGNSSVYNSKWRNTCYSKDSKKDNK
jgi:stage V sporulation protein D (sporulation-specific penicillin-binding protein)